MSLFSKNFYDDDISFAPVFRFIDAFDNWNRNDAAATGVTRSRPIQPVFNPKFDVVEHKNSYELHGEIPGVDRKDISIEFSEPGTLVIHGRVERKYTSGTPPAGFIKGDSSPAGAITESGEKGAALSSPHQATVSHEETEAAKGTSHEQKHPKQAAAPHGSKYWCQERSVGEFHRTFAFPARVDESAVTASLDNGILRVTIPKQEKRAANRITIA